MVKQRKTIDKLVDQKDVLQTLAHCKPQIRKAIINNADKDLIEAICHCVFNLLEGNIVLSEGDIDKLRVYKHAMRKLVDKSSLKNKKKLLVQQGGFLEYLIPAAISGISSIISSYLGSSNSS